MVNFRSFLLGIVTILFIGCAGTFVENSDSAATKLRGATISTRDALLSSIDSTNAAILKSDLPAARLSNSQTRKQVLDLFSKILKYENKFIEVSTNAAKKADEAAKSKPSFFQSINPFYYLGLAWTNVKQAAKVAVGWVGVVVLVGIILQALSFFAGPLAPIASGILSFIGSIIGRIFVLLGKIFSHTIQAIYDVLHQVYGDK